MIKKPERIKELIVDLDGPSGNAYYLLGLAKNLCKSLKMDNSKEIIDEMTLSDYNNLVKTFDFYFGSVCTLTSTNEELINFVKGE